MPPKINEAVAKHKSKRMPAPANLKLVTDLQGNDVLMGRGALATDYEGNLRLRSIVHSRIEEYAAADKRSLKHQIAEEIVAAVKHRGGRFLQSADTLTDIDPALLPKNVAAWYIVDDENVLIAKVKQLLRDVKPRRKSDPPRTEQKAEPPKVVLTTSTSTTTTTASSQSPYFSAAQAPGMDLNFLWQQIAKQPPHAQRGAPPPVQHKAGIANATAQLGQGDAYAILQKLIAGGSSRDLQYDALLALSMASRLQPLQSTADALSKHFTSPTPQEQDSVSNKDLTALAAALIVQNERREREHALANALLAELLPRIIKGSTQQAPVPQTKPPSPPPSDPSMVWLFEQLQKKTDQTFADNRAASGLAATPPPAPAFESLRSLLEGERNTPRASGMLQQPSRIPELERLLVNPGQWTQQNPTQAPPSPSAAAAAPIRTDSASSSIASAAAVAPNSTNAEDGLAQLLRALQKQYFPGKND